MCVCDLAHTTGVLLDLDQVRVLRQSLRLLRSRQLDVKKEDIHAKFEDGVRGKLMKQVVDSGTASALSGRSYTVAGKTGSVFFTESPLSFTTSSIR